MKTKSAPYRPKMGPASLTITEARSPIKLEAAGTRVPEANPNAQVPENRVLRRFEGSAYSGAAVDVGWQGKMIFDLSGMETARKESSQIPVLRQHDANRIVGWADKVGVELSGVKCSGTLADTPAGEEVAKLSDYGFEWQMSVGLDVLEYDDIDEDEEEQVNGRLCKGPMMVARRSKLREVSFVPCGADENTSAFALAAGGGGMIPIHNKKQETAMAEETKVNDALATERKRVADIKAAFPGDTDHALEHIEKGSSVIEAKAAHAEKLAAKLVEANKTIEAMKATKPAAKREPREPVAAERNEAGTVVEEWTRAINAAREKGLTGTKLAREVMLHNPALHAAYLEQMQTVRK